MEKPFFSIIIPTLNEEDYIGRLLTDLKKLKSDSFEVIMVDGQSTDKTVEIARTFAQYIRLQIVMSSVKNVSSQRNEGARIAQGEYLVFFDADIQVPANYCRELKDKLTKNFPAYATTYLLPDSDEVYDEMIAHVYNLCIELSLLIERPFVPGFNFIVRKKIFDAVGGFVVNIVHGEDFDLSFRIFREGFRLTILKKPKLIFSLRRYRAEGRLAVVRKNAKATLHIFMKGPITKNIFAYPMGGGWYKDYKSKNERRVLAKVERFVKRLVEGFLE